MKLEQALMIEGKQHGAPRPVPDPIGPSGALVISVGAREAGAFELSVAIPLDALVAFRKRRIARGGREAGRLDSLSSAVANTGLTIEASLGEAELSLAELRGLAAGDVVVLDRSCTDPAMLSLRGSPRAPFATGSLSGTGDSISLILDK